MPAYIIETSIKDNSTPYRSIFRSLGLATPEAVAHLFFTVNSNLRRANLPPDAADNPEYDDMNAGFEVEAMYEGEEAPTQLPLGKLICGDDSIAAFDTGYDVWIAVKDAPAITVVYNVRGLFLDLVDEMRLRYARANAPTGTTTFGKAQAGCISALAALLGLGYSVTPSAGPSVRITNRRGASAVLAVEPLSGLIQKLLEDRERIIDPEHVFKVLQSMSSNNNDKQEVIQ